MEQVVEVGVAGLLLGEGSESAADGCPHTHKLLQAPDRQTIDPVERQAVTCGCVLELLGSDFTRLQQAHNLIGGFLDGGVEGGDPVLDLGGSRGGSNLRGYHLAMLGVGVARHRQGLAVLVVVGWAHVMGRPVLRVGWRSSLE